MLDWINGKNAVAVDDLRLFRLARDVPSLEKWVAVARKVNDVLERCLNFDPKAFWSSLVHSKSLIKLLESCMDFYIRTGYFNEVDFYMSLHAGDVYNLFVRIYQRVFLVFLRILSNLESEGIVDAVFGHVIYANKIITIEILVKLCSVYGAENKAILSVLLNKIFSLQIGFKRDLESFLSSANQFMEKSKKQMESLISDVENNRIVRNSAHTNLLLKTLDNSSNLFLSLSSFVVAYSQSYQLWKNLIKCIPPFVDHFSRLLTDVNVLNLSASMGSSSFTNLLACKRSRLLQSCLHLYKSFYRLETINDRDRFRMIYDNLGHKEFILRLDDEIDVMAELAKFEGNKNCTKDHLKHVRKALEEAYSIKAKAVRLSLSQRCLLLNIGRSNNEEIKGIIGSLKELFPNFSLQILHLCLRHFDYDSEKATNAIMEKQELPLELRILLKANDNFDDVPQTTIQIQPFSDSCEIEINTFEGIMKHPSETKSLFTLNSKQNDNPEEKEKMAQEHKEEMKGKRLQNLMAKYDGLFDMSSAYAILSSMEKAKQDPNEVEAIIHDGKILVKQDVVRKQLEDPAISVDDKAVIRESYNRYQYELSDDDDEDGRYDLDARFAEEVGVSGRFNKQQLKSKAAQSSQANDDDEYDDTYDDIEMFARDAAASHLDEEEWPKPESNQTVEPAKSSVSKTLPVQDRNAPRTWTNTSNRPNVPSHGRPPQILTENAYRPPHLRSIGNNADNKEPPNKAESIPSGSGNNRAATSNNAGPSNYTGGKARQNKERNKGKMQQRGADKKARGGMF